MRKAALSSLFILSVRSLHGRWLAAPPTAIATGRRTPATRASTKYSPLDQINKDNVKNLQIAWRRSGLPEELRASFPDAQAPANYQHTPLVVDGLLYMSTAVGAVDRARPDHRQDRLVRHAAAAARRPGTRARRRRRAASPTGPTARTRASSPTSAATSSR